MQSRTFSLACLALLAASAPDLAHADDAPPLSIYGFARFDLIADDSRMSDVQRPFFVESESGDEDDAELSMHPRLSRIGLSIDEWKLTDPFSARGLIEIDFQSETEAPGVRLRHAYAALTLYDDADDDLELLAGQTWDLMSPLFPSSNQDTLLGNAGNTGWLRPQLRTTLSFSHVRMAVAVGQSGAVDQQDADGDGRLDGVEAAVPMFQWLFEGEVPVSAGNLLRFGTWGHVAREQLGDGSSRSSYSVGAHALVPVGQHVTVLGELFFGENLDDVRGGIGQGVGAISGDEIGAWGGWLELAYVVSARHMLAAGSSLDQLRQDDRELGARSRNGTLYLVHRYRPVEAFQLGLEYSRWITEHEGADRATANRFNLSVSAFF